MKPLTIGDRLIEAGGRTLVIAEIGVNHDGNERRAIELVAHAKSAGADAVKLQVFSADRLMHHSARFADYQVERVDDADPIAMLRRYELSDDALTRIVSAIVAAGMLAIATPFSPGDVERLARLDLAAVKIASPDLVNHLLLERAASLGKPLLISTGASTSAEVRQCIDFVRPLAPFAMLHCVSSYPTPTHVAMLGWIGELASMTGGVVGYSDHTTEPLAGALAVAAGAAIVEKHLTYDRAAAGPDHEASCDPAGFAEYVRLIRLAESMRGSPGKRVLDVEGDVRAVSRQSLVASRDIAAGDEWTSDSLTTMRPGTGVLADQIAIVVGRVATRDVGAGEMIQPGDWR